MGYESKIIVALKYTSFPEKRDGKGKKLYNYACVVATIDMAKLANSFHDKILNKSKLSKCYIYADDGDTRLFEDKYGDEFKELNFKKLITYLKDESSKDDYRRYPPAIGLLEGFYNYRDRWGKDLVILHYGY
jgi:hypothetical protein